MRMVAISAGLVIALAAMIHSIRGEQRMIRPLLAADAFATMPRVGRAIRFTWHMSSLLMLLTALTIAWPGTPIVIVVLIGASFLGLGLIALAMTKGRHVSGPMFSAAGLLALIFALTEQAHS